jgi:hypothetical protein
MTYNPTVLPGLPSPEDDGAAEVIAWLRSKEP